MSRSDEATVLSLLPWQRSRRRQAALTSVVRALEAPDAPAQVAQASEMPVYFAAKELGAADAAPLLAHMTREQVQTLLDLEGWDRGQLSPADLLEWLEAFREAGLESLVGAFRALDPETAAAFFARRLHVALVVADEAADPAQGPLPEWLHDETLEVAETPDRRFWIGPRREEPDGTPIDEEERKAVFQLVADLYRDEDWEWTAGILRIVESDFLSDLEETALRFRDARLEDLGFPSRERALEIYAPVDPESELSSARADLVADPPLELPPRYEDPIQASALQAYLSEVKDLPTLARIESELVPLIHAVFVADGIAPAASEAAETAVASVVGTLSVALQAPVSPLTPQERLESIPIRTLFQAGHSLLLRLRRRARALLDRPGVGLIEPEDRTALGAIAAARPRFPEGLDAFPGPLDPARVELLRPLGSAADLQQVDAWLRAQEGLMALDELLELGARIQELPEPMTPEDPRDRTLRKALTTGAARVLLRQPFSFEPIASAALVDLADRMPGLDPSAFARQVARGLGGEGLTESVVECTEWTLALGLSSLREELLPAAGRDRVEPGQVTTLFVAHIF